MSQQSRGEGSAGNIMSDDNTKADQGYTTTSSLLRQTYWHQFATLPVYPWDSVWDEPLRVLATQDTLSKCHVRADQEDCCPSANQEDSSPQSPTNGHPQSCIFKSQELRWTWFLSPPPRRHMASTSLPPFPLESTAQQLGGMVQGEWRSVTCDTKLKDIPHSTHLHFSYHRLRVLTWKRRE